MLIIADDLGYGELGCYGGTDIPTPSIDSLANSGARFTSGYVTAPFCAASRAGLLTGRYQTSFGFEFNPIGAKNSEAGIGLPVKLPTIADRLRAVGYATALVGKWHLGGTAPFHPMRRGYDQFFGFLHEGHFYAAPPWKEMTSWLRRKRLPGGAQGRWTSADGKIIWSSHMGHDEPPYDADNPLLQGSQPVEVIDLTTQLTDQAIDFVRHHQHQPFFLTLAYNAVHSPLQARDDYLQRHRSIADMQRRIFAGMLSQLDDSVGRVVMALREFELDKQTIVVFMSDNGGPTKELTSRNDPLRGGKGQLLEGGIRVPMILVWPGFTRPEQVIETPINALDISTSLMQACGADTEQMDGTGLKAVIADGESLSKRPPLYWRVGQQMAMRSGKWKIYRPAGSRWQLFDVEQDIGESNDVAGQNPETVKTLVEQWESWNQRQIAPLW